MSPDRHLTPGEPQPASRARGLRRNPFLALLGLSLLLHLVFTPLAGWIGWGVWLLNRPVPEAEPLPDKPEEVAIELSEVFAEELPKPEADAPLPASDPVSFIDHIIPAQPALPVAPTPAPKPAAEKLDPKAEAQAEAAAQAERDRAASAAASTQPSTTATAEAAPEASTQSSAEPAASGAASAPPEEPAPEAEASDPKHPPIDNPVALMGKAATLHETPPSVSLVIFTERIRDHELGRRVALLLPQLPQWEDYFGEGTTLNPVRDFDRILMLGPSFVRSAELVVGVQYNVPMRKIRAAVDQLVKRRGNWLPKSKVPAALTYADRAERLVLLPAKGFALVVPPHMQQAALAAKMHGIAGPKGAEAVTFSVAKPRAPLARVGLEVPATITQLRGRITALPDGKVQLELDATDADEETAKASAAQMMQSINATVDLVTGVSNVLSRFGFGGFGAGAQMPRVTLEATGKEIHGSQVLSAAQVAFILDRIERQVIGKRLGPAPQGSSAQHGSAP